MQAAESQRTQCRSTEAAPPPKWKVISEQVKIEYGLMGDWVKGSGINRVSGNCKLCLQFILKVLKRDWGEGSVGKILAKKAEDPSLYPQHSCKKPGMTECACNPSAVEAKTGGVPGIHRPTSLT